MTSFNLTKLQVAYAPKQTELFPPLPKKEAAPAPSARAIPSAALPDDSLELLSLDFNLQAQHQPSPVPQAPTLQFSDSLDPLEAKPIEKPAEIEIQTAGKVSREQRALSVAYQVGRQFGWSREDILVLQPIFTQHGWSATRRYIETLIEQGATAPEIEAAYHCRRYWVDNPGFWEVAEFSTSYGRRRGNTSNSISWQICLCIIRMFDGQPDPLEVENLLDTVFDRWVHSRRLTSSYPSFMSYIRELANTKTADEVFADCCLNEQMPEYQTSLTEWEQPITSAAQHFLELHGHMPDYWYNNQTLPVRMKTNWPSY